MSTYKARTSLESPALFSTPDSRPRLCTASTGLRLTRLAACLVLMLPMSEICSVASEANSAPDHGLLRRAPRPLHPAATRTVTNCTDHNVGSLRDVAAAAQDGDLIDLTGLSCSVITLTSGEIPLAADNVTITAASPSALAIEANYRSRIFSHSGTGVVTINNLTITSGYVESDTASEVKGGCVYSSGSIILNNSMVDGCGSYVSYLPSAGKASGGALSAANYVYLHNSSITHAHTGSTIGQANGGAIYAGDDVYLNNSTVSANVAGSYSGATARGGAIFAIGNIVMNRSTVAGNMTYSPYKSLAGPSYGGGIYVRGFPRGARGTQISNSTISGNDSHNVGGLEILNGGGTNYNANIVNSTISSNYGHNRSGGIVTSTPLTLSNSTVVSNYSGSSAVAAGLEAYSAPVILQSSILALNYGPTASFDFDATFVTGSNNLITSSSIAPPGTITADPLLMPLANNGGPTQTHMLLMSSPAIGHGNNIAGLLYDQRGPGFSRVLGSAPDIGAVEADYIFADGFENFLLMRPREETANSAHTRPVSLLAYEDSLISFADGTGKRDLACFTKTTM